MVKKFYQDLEIDDKADISTIKLAYRRLAREYHPDKNPNNPAAEEKFKAINLAHEILVNSEKRKLYDIGLIDDKGNETEYTPQPKPQPRPEPRPEPKQQPKQQPKSESRSETKPEPKQQSKPKSKPQHSPSEFFHPRPAFYLFFNTRAEAVAFYQPHVVYMYTPIIFVTPTPLPHLLELINEVNRASRTSFPSAETREGFNRAHNQQPSHVFIKTNYVPHVEIMINRLRSMVKLEEIGNELRQDYQSSSPKPSSK